MFNLQDEGMFKSKINAHTLAHAMIVCLEGVKGRVRQKGVPKSQASIIAHLTNTIMDR